MADNEQLHQLNIELPANLELIYSNFAIINHSLSEIVVDLGQLLPNVPQVRIRARVLMTPANAKLLHRALGENLANFERRFGEIKMPDASNPDEGFLGGLHWRVGNQPTTPPEQP